MSSAAYTKSFSDHVESVHRKGTKDTKVTQHSWGSMG
jgi:hypothetical protein